MVLYFMIFTAFGNVIYIMNEKRLSLGYTTDPIYVEKVGNDFVDALIS